MRRSLRPVLAGLAVVGLLTACTAGGDDSPSDDATHEAPSAAETEAVDGALEDLDAGAGEDAEPVAIEEELPVLATRETSDGRTSLEIDLNSVRVTGEVMTVVFTARNVGDDDRWQISGYFDDGSGYAPLDADGTRDEENTDHSTVRAWTTDGVTVLDGVNNRVHRAAYDTAGNCACSVNLGERFIAPGEALVLTTAFAAPPEDVTEVTVQIPGAGSFDGVPLSR